jgi:hypothetical protein
MTARPGVLPSPAGPPIGARAPLAVVHERFARTGAGGLSGRLWANPLAVLAILARRGDKDTGVVVVTAAQLADRAGCSPRTVRRSLARLEALGVLTWRRGGIVDAAPSPSVIRVNKARLLELVADGAAWLSTRLLDRATSTAARIAALGRRDVDTNRRLRKRPGHPMWTRTHSPALRGTPGQPERPPVALPDPQLPLISTRQPDHVARRGADACRAVLTR